MIVRQLRPGDEQVVKRLADEAPPARAAELLADERTIFLVALEGDEPGPIGFVLTNEANEAAMELYRSAGGVRPNADDVLCDFDHGRG